VYISTFSGTTNYGPDNSVTSSRTYYKTGDMIIAYIYSLAPKYNQRIQTMGWSTGGQPAMDSAIRINLTYQDTRYAINRITFLDARCRSYGPNITTYMNNPVHGEQCWVDSYESTDTFYSSVLNVKFSQGNHLTPPEYYRNSLINPQMHNYNGGLVTGAYWSILGAGKNLQMRYSPNTTAYVFMTYNAISAGSTAVQFFNESLYPGKLPEPVTLMAPVDAGDPNGAILTCKVSQNAVGYQLLFGSNPDRVMGFTVISDTPNPPSDIIIGLPFEETWWTVKAYDRYGTTIYADPICINDFILSLPVKNLTTGKRYGTLQDAIDAAAPGDEIEAKQGTYNENIDFKGKNVVIRSTNPDDSAVVAATLIKGNSNSPTVTFSDNENTSCVLAGFTITGGNKGIFCFGASPTISKCSITSSSGCGIEMITFINGRIKRYNYPEIYNCIIAMNKQYGISSGNPKITNCTIVDNLLGGIYNSTATVKNSIIYFNGEEALDSQINGQNNIATYSNIQGLMAGTGNIDADPLFPDSAAGDYHLLSQVGRWDPARLNWVHDTVSSPCIDAGDPVSDVSLEPQPNGNRINIGAYGGTSEAGKSVQ
jgi:hypothetical protein